MILNSKTPIKWNIRQSLEVVNMIGEMSWTLCYILLMSCLSNVSMIKTSLTIQGTGK